MTVHGKKISWENVFVDTPKENNVEGCEPKIQKVLRADGSYTIQVYMQHSPANKRVNATCYEPSLDGLKVLIALIEELYNIKIGGDKDGV